MKQELDEEGIRQLFHNERQADESVAPRFTATLEAALSRRRADHSPRLIWRAAVALAALVAIIGSVLLFLPRSANERPGAPAIIAREPHQPENTAVPTSVDSVPPPKPRAVTRSRGTRRQRELPQRAASLISQWHSPTDFLLRTPGDQLLKTVPRVGASAIEIKVNFSDGKN